MGGIDQKSVNHGIQLKLGAGKEAKLSRAQYSEVALRLDPMRSNSVLHPPTKHLLSAQSVAYFEQDLSQYLSTQSIKLPKIRHHCKDSLK
jgi:hypothetical protein